MSDDIRHAYVYISTHENIEEKKLLQMLKDSSYYIITKSGYEIFAKITF